jgi:flagellar biosynthesis/type III secretory pathway chaperone
MYSKELMELNKVLEEERNALMQGAVEEILKWSSYKIRLLHLLKDKELSPKEIELLKEIYEKNEKNKRLIEAGLNFVNEAYKILYNFLTEKGTYGNQKVPSHTQLISRRT